MAKVLKRFKTDFEIAKFRVLCWLKMFVLQNELTKKAFLKTQEWTFRKHPRVIIYKRCQCKNDKMYWNYQQFKLQFKHFIFSFLFSVDSRHLKECIERAEFSLNLELWFGEQQPSQPQQTDATINEPLGNFSDANLMLASTRTLQLNFHPGRGLHYHLPVLFDYFHLAAVSLGIHASLIAMHQPYIKWVSWPDFCGRKMKINWDT